MTESRVENDRDHVRIANDMPLLWFVTGASLVVALVAWRQARRTAKRLEQLTQMYWELKYQHGELRAQAPAQGRPHAAAPTAVRRLPAAAGRHLRPTDLAQALTVRVTGHFPE